jgi:hypothetical protein
VLALKEMVSVAPPPVTFAVKDVALLAEVLIDMTALVDDAVTFTLLMVVPMSDARA